MMRFALRPLAWGCFALAALITLAPAMARDTDKKPESSEKQEANQTKKVSLAVLTLKEDYPEGTAAPGLFGELKPHLREVLNRMEKIGKDEKLQGLVLKLRSPHLGLGKVDEVRGAISRLRAAGKKVYADVESVATKDYLIAAACDEIVMPPSGELLITGLQAEVTFFKGLFDKLGIQADFIQMGAYKGAAEPFTRTEMSPEFRQQFEKVVDDYYDQLVTTIAKDRKLDVGQVKDLIDEGLLSAARAKETRLIDRIAYEDEFRKQLQTETGAAEVALLKDYGKKKVDADLSGLAGFMKLMELMMGVESQARSGKLDKIAVIYAVGPIMESEKSESELFETQAVTSDGLVKAIRQAEEDAKVKGIVLRVDSPGGSALASDLIWREVVKAKKPLVASMGDTAASGGYYISMGADKILAEPGTLTGSIGVVGGKLALKGLFNKIGITTDIISRGKNSGTFSMTQPFTDTERAAWKRLMGNIYRQFTAKAAEGRKMDLEKLENLAGGRVFTGRMAVANGLVDKLGTLEDAIVEAKTMAGLKADEKVDLLILPKPRNFFEQLLEGPQLESEMRSLVTGSLLPSELQAILRTATVWQRLFERPMNTVLPYHVEFK